MEKAFVSGKMSDGDPVCVFVGHWRCLNDEWKFIYTAGVMAKTIIIKDNMSFEDLKFQILTTFNIDGSKQNIQLSFWSSEVSNALTQSRLPPVSLSSDNDFSQFKNSLSVCKSLSILMNIDRLEVEEVNSLQNSDVSNPLTVSTNIYPYGKETMVQLLEGFEAAHRVTAFKAVGGTSGGEEEGLIPFEDSGSSKGFTVMSSPVSSEDRAILEWLDDFEATHLINKGKAVAGVQQTNVPESVGTGDPSVDVFDSDDDSSGALNDLFESIEEENHSINDISGNSTTVNTNYREDRVENSMSSSDQLPTIRLRTQTENPSFSLGISEDEEECVPVNTPDDEVPLKENQPNPTVLSFDLTDPIFNDAEPDTDYLPRFEVDDQWYVGRTFDNKEEFKHCLSIYALERCFGYIIDKSCKSRVVAVCVDRRGGCPWRIFAKGFPDILNLEVRTMVFEHTCGISARAKFSKRATPKVLGELLFSKYAHGKTGPRACDIPDICLADFNLNISYMKAWHAKEIALEKARGKDIDNYKLLSTYLRLLVETNPGTITKLHTTVDESGKSRFKYLFVAFGASIAGIPFLRKVVVIDGTQLKGKYKGTLVTASCQDGNMQIFPLALGVVDSENDNSWVWFLEQLKEFLSDDDDLVFVSDRHASIKVGIARVYPKSHHAYCIVHLHRNVKYRFKSEGLADWVNRAARAYTRSEFENHFHEIEARSRGCAAYLLQIGFEFWARCYCGGNRYNLMSSNISESLNSALKTAVVYPIITMIEFARNMLMRWFLTRREKSAKCKSHCTPVIEKLLLGFLKISSSMTAIAANSWVYQVNDAKGRCYVVDTDNKSCSCKVFDTIKIPCAHAVAASQLRGIDIYYLVDPVYKTSFRQQLYAETIMPVPHIEHSTIPDDELPLFPPNTRRPPGRPKRARIPSQGEIIKVGPYKAPRCGRCSQSGHNRKTCKNVI